MRHEDLLREIRDSIRANTEASKKLHDMLLLMNNPVRKYDPQPLSPPMVAWAPGQAIRVDLAGGVEEYPGITDQERSRIEREAFEKFRHGISPSDEWRRDDVAQVTNWDRSSNTKAP